MYKFLREERGSASLIEYTFVFPIVFIVCCLLIFMGFLQYERSVVVSAAQRGAIIGAKLLADPHFAEIAGLDTSDDSDYLEVGQVDFGNYKDSSSKPYRYLFNTNDGFNEAEQRVRAMVNANSMFFKPDTKIDVKLQNSFISKQMKISITKDYNLSNFAKMVGLPPIGQISYEVTATGDNPSEFIRNIDFADDLVRTLSGGDISNHVNTLFKKITDIISIFK